MEVFENQEFGSIRVLQEAGKTFFCASDVAKALGYVNPYAAVKRHCRGPLKEALPLFETVGVSDFLLGQKWMPVDYTGVTSFGIFNFIAATVYVSLNGLVLAVGILLAVMLLPYLVFSCSDKMLKEREKYLEASKALGISDWYAVATMILPAAMPNILMSMVLAVGRAMGETMAVMMVMGNANLFPKLLEKSESIASVIALEMGTAVYGSLHYHALYAAGMVLVVILFVINLGIHLLRRHLLAK